MIATCERAFSVQILIKTKVIIRLGSKNLKAMLRIALERPIEGVYDIISDIVPLWKNDIKYHFLYANPSFYLNSPNIVSVSDVSCLFGAIDTNGNGTQISWLFNTDQPPDNTWTRCGNCNFPKGTSLALIW